MWRTTSSPPKRTNSMPSTSSRMSPITSSPERWSRRRSICVMSPVTTIFELKPSRVRNIFICSGRRVLGLVEDDERVVQRAAAHEGERRDLDHAALQVLVHLLGLEHVVEGVEQRAQVGVDLGHQVAGQEAEPLARLDRRARQDDAVDLAARERRDRHRHREERLAGAGRADADRDRGAADRVDVALLVDGLRRDAQAAVAPDDVLEDAGSATRARSSAPADRLDRPGRDLVALAHQVATARATTVLGHAPRRRRRRRA